MSDRNRWQSNQRLQYTYRTRIVTAFLQPCTVYESHLLTQGNTYEHMVVDNSMRNQIIYILHIMFTRDAPPPIYCGTLRVGAPRYAPQPRTRLGRQPTITVVISHGNNQPRLTGFRHSIKPSHVYLSTSFLVHRLKVPTSNGYKPYVRDT
jgi:hypothetical protein